MEDAALLGHGCPEAESAFRPGLISLYRAKLRLQPEVVLVAPSASSPGTGKTQVIMGQIARNELGIEGRSYMLPSHDFKEEVVAGNATL